MPAIDGILETCLYVADIERARSFYEGVLGLDPMLEEERIVAYDLGPASVLLLFKQGATLEPIALPGGIIPPHDSHGPAHLAFAISNSALEEWRGTFRQAGIAIEAEVSWPKGGLSLYIRDPDDHALEFATPGLWRNYPSDLRPAP